MTEYPVRLFDDDAAVRRIGEGLVSMTLPRAEWTHEAHLAACVWLLRERANILLERDLPDIIRRYNLAVGGINDDTQGYHETLTQLYILGVRGFLMDWGEGGLVAQVNALLDSPIGKRDWPLQHYTRERLFSVEARRGWVEPDLTPVVGTDQ